MDVEDLFEAYKVQGFTMKDAFSERRNSNPNEGVKSLIMYLRPFAKHILANCFVQFGRLIHPPHNSRALHTEKHSLCFWFMVFEKGH